MNFVLNVPVVGRLLGQVAASGVESEWRSQRVPWGALAIVGLTALWIALGAGVLAAVGEMGPLITSIRTR
jgi:hypothetical protein